ncbi:MAG: isopenicillin N synthase family oxygenase [Proteobacteria bacterium]|nr:isopenicillin N synthase family oxygenase [Pseudomonadota bacterium]
MNSAINPDTGKYDRIPILDMGSYLAGDAGAREKLASEIRHVQENIGFSVFINHGVNFGLLDGAYAAMKKFFALPLEEKKKHTIDDTSLGYVPIRSTMYVSSVINRNTKKDLNETLTIARDRPDDHPAVQERRRFHGPNRWPEIDGFRGAIVAYQEAIEVMGHNLLPLYALALDKPADFFAPFFTDPIMWSRNAYYPPVQPEDNQFGIAPHCDHSFLTMLPLADEPGLQVLGRDGQWMWPDPVEGGIVVNTGEFLNRWSNGRFLATPHRVVQPSRERYSIATFFNPDSDTSSEALDTCVDEDNPPKFEPMTMQAYVEHYIDSNYLRGAGGTQDND